MWLPKGTTFKGTMKICCRYRPGVAQRDPGGGEAVSLKHRPHLPPRNAAGTHFHYGLSRHQGHGMVGRKMSLKNPLTPPGIDPGTARQVTQRLNHYATPGTNVDL